MVAGKVPTLLSMRRALQAGLFALFAMNGCAGTDVVAGSGAAYRPVVSFNFNYHFYPDPGLRAWSLDPSNKWHERYPNGTDSIFDEVGRGSLSGCPGSIATHSSEPNFHVFVPDLGCARMIAFFIGDDGKWKALGRMRDVN